VFSRQSFRSRSRIPSEEFTHPPDHAPGRPGNLHSDKPYGHVSEENDGPFCRWRTRTLPRDEPQLGPYFQARHAIDDRWGDSGHR